jgi:hypothetical protein
MRTPTGATTLATTLRNGLAGDGLAGVLRDGLAGERRTAGGYVRGLQKRAGPGSIPTWGLLESK